MKRILPFVIILLVLGIAIGSAMYLKQAASNPTPLANASPATNTTSPATEPVNNANLPPGAQPPWVLGPATAPVTLEEFGDFECPPCGLLHPILLQMRREFGDKIRLIFRENPIVPNHQHALAAASSAEAAGNQGKFWEMHDLLYENQKTWHEAFDVRPIFEGYAKQIGLDLERFKQDVNSDQVAKRITDDGIRGRAMGVKGTPTVFMNGHEVPFEQLPAEKLRVVIKKELGEQ
ncbi:MAG: protein-disulfide isomerase [Blastocatellia bacterium]|nr:MAG: protein-disulfide isomerase [Blastocatellia bacterium]